MPKCVPIKDIRDTAAFSELVEKSPEPITVTKNGYDQFVVIRSACWSPNVSVQQAPTPTPRRPSTP